MSQKPSNKKILFGFWRKKENEKSDLPFPISYGDYPERVKIIEALKKKQKNILLRQSKGFSKCRLCGCQNGSGEYETEKAIWPEGALHYIEEHFIKPPEDFIDFLMKSKNLSKK